MLVENDICTSWNVEVGDIVYFNLTYWMVVETYENGYSFVMLSSGGMFSKTYKTIIEVRDMLNKQHGFKMIKGNKVKLCKIE